MNVAGSGRVGSSFSIRVAQNNVLGWRWTVEKEHDGFFEPVASGRSLTRKMAKRAAIKAMNCVHKHNRNAMNGLHLFI